MANVVITRKIQLLIDTQDKEVFSKHKETLYHWQNWCHRMANYIITHMELMKHYKEFDYVTNDVKIKLANIAKDGDGIFTTSSMNTTYQILSKKGKGDIPMAIATSLNSRVRQDYNNDSKEVWMGKRSIRSYRSDIPIPIRSVSIINIKQQAEYRNYTFTIHGIDFRTNFGRDRSGNQIIWERALAGEYKLCDSQIQMSGNKIFLLAVFSFEKQKFATDPNIIAQCSLDVDKPMAIDIDGRIINIGNKEEFLYRRLAIQESRKRRQIDLRYNHGGKGRKHKLHSLDQFTLAEKNYVNTKIHQYTKKLIDICLQNKCGKIILINQEQKEEEAKEVDNVPYLLRNWSYYNMKEKIMYKANKVGIEVEVQ